jgi:hypothetical protein
LTDTSFFPSRHRCCRECSSRIVTTKAGEVVEYYHRGVLCHLIGFDLAVPLDVEFQRRGEGEVPAAVRLLDRVFGAYARFFDAVVGDALYLEAPFVNFCLDHGKHVLTTLKGDHRLLMQDAQGLFEAIPPRRWDLPGQSVRFWDEEGFACEGIDPPLRVLHTQETVTRRQRIAGQSIERQEQHDWWWATTIPQQRVPTRQIWLAGHGRWDIENQAFNVLATHWHLDHCFRHDPQAITNFVLTLLIAFVLMQAFYLRNCKAPVRERFTLIAISRQLYAGLTAERIAAPWQTNHPP